MRGQLATVHGVVDAFAGGGGDHARGVTGEQRITIDGGEPIVIAGAEFTELVGSLGGVGAGAALSCSPTGDLLATAGPISQTYVRM
jgi:hypothetical protein